MPEPAKIFRYVVEDKATRQISIVGYTLAPHKARVIYTDPPYQAIWVGAARGIPGWGWLVRVIARTPAEEFGGEEVVTVEKIGTVEDSDWRAARAYLIDLCARRAAGDRLAADLARKGGTT